MNAPSSFSHLARPEKRVTVMQGQSLVSDARQETFTTVLGSCIATCLFDPKARVGGMNHFLLAEPQHGRSVDNHFGVYLMEVLINEMLAHGASKRRLRAHLYGGANMHAGMARIGSANAEFATRFLECEGIPVAHVDTGGTLARRVDFRPALGQVRCRSVPDTIVTQEQPTRRPKQAVGDVELF